MINRQKSNPSDAEALETFIIQFVDPIIEYIAERQTIHDTALGKLLKYKRLCEMFDKEDLLKLGLDREKAKPQQVEQLLKTHFYRFLFLEGLDFSIEAVDPSGKGRIDVRTAKFDDGSRIHAEAKVFDGVRRGKGKIREGFK